MQLTTRVMIFQGISSISTIPVVRSCQLLAKSLSVIARPREAQFPFFTYLLTYNGSERLEDRYMTVNWYYRPCQTSHLAQRTFYEQEIFKTSLFVDHKLEDVIERISVMHIDDYLKGRYDSWTDDMPLYVVEHRWIIETNSFSKIAKW